MPWSNADYHNSLGQLIDSLERIPSLRDPVSRRLCLDLLVDYLGVGLVIDELPGTRAHLISIVQACRHQHPRALSAFIAALEQLEPGSIPVQRARSAFQDMTAQDLVNNEDRKKLLELLDGGPTDRVAELVRWASGNVVELTSKELGPADAVDILEQQNARLDGLPPLFVFVERFADMVDEKRAEDLRKWNNQQAMRAELTKKLDAFRLGHPPQPTRRVAAYLVIRIEQDLLDPELFIVVHWRQHNPIEWRPRRGERFSGDLDAVRTHVADLVTEAEAGWAQDAAKIRVEFLLPYELLNLPVDRWYAERGGPVPRRLGLHYQVVIRSLDRARAPHWHREWRRRWELFTQGAERRTSPADHWLWSDGAQLPQLTVLDAKLAISPDVVALVLHSPPAGAEPGEVVIGLRTGVPVLVWHRAGGHRAAFEDELSALHDKLPDLVEQVRVLRSQGTQAESHVGNRVSLLWDDPDRLVEPQDPPAVPTAGTTPTDRAVS